MRKVSQRVEAQCGQGTRGEKPWAKGLGRRERKEKKIVMRLGIGYDA